MPALTSLHAFCRLVQKDVTQELRARRAWPGMLLLGLTLVLLLGMQIELPAVQKQQVVSGVMWLSVFFAGTLSLERSFASEREEGCWQTLLLYPISPAVLFLSKAAVNFVALACLECVVMPAFVLLSGVPLLDRPGPLILTAALANAGFASLGVLVSALTASTSPRGGLLALLLLPLMTPTILGAAEATRLLMLGDLGDAGWRWVQLLGAFAVLYTTLGTLVFEFVLEE
jgi:heme exporter protein B